MNVYVCSYITVYKIHLSFVCIEDRVIILVQDPKQNSEFLDLGGAQYSRREQARTGYVYRVHHPCLMLKTNSSRFILLF